MYLLCHKGWWIWGPGDQNIALWGEGHSTALILRGGGGGCGDPTRYQMRGGGGRQALECGLMGFRPNGWPESSAFAIYKGYATMVTGGPTVSPLVVPGSAEGWW